MKAAALSLAASALCLSGQATLADPADSKPANPFEGRSGFLPRPVAKTGGKPVVFEVSKVGGNKTRLKKVFHAVQRLELADELAEAGISSGQILVLQKIDAKNYLVRNSRAGNALWLELAKPRNMADGTWLTLDYTATGNTREYKSTQGTKMKFSHLKEVDLASTMKLMTKESFVWRLKAGDSWLLKNFHFQECDRCFGDGRLTGLEGNRRCPKCLGRGNFLKDLLVKW